MITLLTVAGVLNNCILVAFNFNRKNSILKLLTDSYECN